MCNKIWGDKTDWIQQNYSLKAIYYHGKVQNIFVCIQIVIVYISIIIFLFDSWNTKFMYSTIR